MYILEILGPATAFVSFFSSTLSMGPISSCSSCLTAVQYILEAMNLHCHQNITVLAQVVLIRKLRR